MHPLQFMNLFNIAGYVKMFLPGINDNAPDLLTMNICKIDEKKFDKICNICSKIVKICGKIVNLLK